MGSYNGLTAISIGLYGCSIVSAVLATRKLNNKPFKDNEKEYIEAYIPSGILFVTASSLLVISNIQTTRRFESVLGAYQITRDALDDLRTSLPVKVLNEANNKIIQDKVDGQFEPPVDPSLVIQPNAYCLDTTTGQSFILSVEKIHKACQNLNYQIINQMMATMDDYCDELGLENIKGGSMMGWTSGPLVFKITTRLKDDTMPVVVISADPLPVPLYK